MLIDYIIEHDLHFVALTETWLSNSDKHKKTIGDLTPSGYDIFQAPRPNRTGGGVALIYKNTIKCDNTYVFNSSTFESFCCDLTFKGTSTPVKLVVVYRPRYSKKNRSTVNMFLDEFASHLTTLISSQCKILIVGDFNFHFDVADDPDTVKLQDLLETCNMIQFIKEPTHISGHTLDLVVTRSSDDLIHSVEVGTFFSDHNAVHCKLKLMKPSHPKNQVTYRKLKMIDHAHFTRDIRESNLITNPKSDLSGLIDQYNETLRTILEKHAPLKSKTVTLRPSNPWYNENITEAKKKRKRLERRWRKTRLQIDRDLFKAQRDLANSLINKAKSSYYKDKIVNCTNSKELFDIVESLLHQKGKPKLPTHLSNQDLANTFNTYFITKIDNIRSSFNHEVLSLNHEQHPAENVLNDNTPKLETFSPASEDEIRKLIMSSPSKHCHLDPIPTWILKEHIDILLPTITRIVNLSLTTSTFPSQFKSAIVKPLLKKSSLDPENLKNYRPVSNLTFVSKIIEKIVATCLNEYLETYNLLEKYQSAYKKFHGTETAILKVQNDILRKLDNKHAVFLVLLDLSAAFDTIDHNILLSRLNATGVKGPALSWISSYLSCRNQSVCIGNDLSSPANLPFGVPQGSVLGPLFFTIYASPVVNIARNHNLSVHTYADDTQLYLSFNVNEPSEENLARERIELCISDIKSWMSKNKLKLNDDKTELLIVSSKNAQNKIQNKTIQIGSSTISASTNVRNLGIYLDSNMSMENHIKKVCQSAYFQIRNLSSIRKLLSKDTAEILMHAFVTSRLDNGNALLNGITEQQLKKLQLVQNSAARVLTMTRKFDHITPILINLHWLPVRYRIQYKTLLITWKGLNNMAPSYITELLSPYTPKRSLRSSDQSLLAVPRTKSSLGDRSFSVVAPKLWNSLPTDLRQANSLHYFKTGLKTFLFNNAYVS